MPGFDLGESIPPDTAHAVSVSLPTWKSNIGYEEGEEWVVNRMSTGYPRFFIHKSIEAFADEILSRHGKEGQKAMLFPTPRVARRCLAFMQPLLSASQVEHVAILDFALDTSRSVSPTLTQLSPRISAVLYSQDAQSVAKQYWQHTGDGISSRRAEFCHHLYKEGLLITLQPGVPAAAASQSRQLKGPKRYQRPGSVDDLNTQVADTGAPGMVRSTTADEIQESTRFLEERFGRNLDLSLVQRARSAIRRRIAGAVTSDVESTDQQLSPMSTNTRGLQNLREDDVYLFPAGMNAIFSTHQALLSVRPPLKSINFGFPYVDTLKILQKFGPGAVFFGNGSDQELDELENLLKGGERFLSLFCEFPGNPLLKCPDLKRIRQLADEYDFVVVVDETIGTFGNINVLPTADVVVSSLTKIFSGDSNVMGGAAILNPNSRCYTSLKTVMETDCEDTYWPEDVIFMERNSRDFSSRIERINKNAETICSTLLGHSLVKEVFYPKYNPSCNYYDAFRIPGGGYGGLLSVVFHDPQNAQAFYDAMDIAKGPSLGTNFTLCSPYVLLAHYQELEWSRQFGVEPSLVRISVGLEETLDLKEIFGKALAAAVRISESA